MPKWRRQQCPIPAYPPAHFTITSRRNRQTLLIPKRPTRWSLHVAFLHDPPHRTYSARLVITHLPSSNAEADRCADVLTIAGNRGSLVLPDDQWHKRRCARSLLCHLCSLSHSLSEPPLAGARRFGQNCLERRSGIGLPSFESAHLYWAMVRWRGLAAPL